MLTIKTTVITANHAIDSTQVKLFGAAEPNLGGQSTGQYNGTTVGGNGNNGLRADYA